MLLYDFHYLCPDRAVQNRLQVMPRSLHKAHAPSLLPDKLSDDITCFHRGSFLPRCSMITAQSRWQRVAVRTRKSTRESIERTNTVTPTPYDAVTFTQLRHPFVREERERNADNNNGSSTMWKRWHIAQRFVYVGGCSYESYASNDGSEHVIHPYGKQQTPELGGSCSGVLLGCEALAFSTRACFIAKGSTARNADTTHVITNQSSWYTPVISFPTLFPLCCIFTRFYYPRFLMQVKPFF